MKNLKLVRIPMEDPKDLRLALTVSGQVVLRAPARKLGVGLSSTHPGQVAWVRSETSRALARLEKQLEKGDRLLRPVKTKAAKALMAESVRTGCSFLTAKELAEETAKRRGISAAKATKEATVSTKPEAAGVDDEVYAAALARIAALEADLEGAAKAAKSKK